MLPSVLLVRVSGVCFGVRVWYAVLFCVVVLGFVVCGWSGRVASLCARMCVDAPRGAVRAVLRARVCGRVCG